MWLARTRVPTTSSRSYEAQNAAGSSRPRRQLRRSLLHVVWARASGALPFDRAGVLRSRKRGILIHQQQLFLFPDTSVVGLRNYVDILGDETYGFWDALRISVLWTVGTVALQFIVGMGADLLMDRDVPG